MDDLCPREPSPGTAPSCPGGRSAPKLGTDAAPGLDSPPPTSSGLLFNNAGSLMRSVILGLCQVVRQPHEHITTTTNNRMNGVNNRMNRGHEQQQQRRVEGGYYKIVKCDSIRRSCHGNAPGQAGGARQRTEEMGEKRIDIEDRGPITTKDRGVVKSRRGRKEARSEEGKK